MSIEERRRGHRVAGWRSPQGEPTGFSLVREVGSFFQEFGIATDVVGLPGGERTSVWSGSWSPDVEVFRRGRELVVRADLPGMHRDDIALEIDGDGLMIQGERRPDPQREAAVLFTSGPKYGSFYRRIPLPEGVDAESARATLSNGVLEIVMATSAPSSNTQAGAPPAAAPARESRRDPARAIFAQRAWRGIRQLAKHASTDALTEAAAAPTDVGVVMRALEQADVLSDLTEEDPLAPARIRGLQERERLLSSVEGGTWDADKVAKHLHLSRQAVNRRRQQRTLIGIHVGRHGFRYPAWQFTKQGTLEGLEAVLALLRDHDPWMQQIFMVNGNERLGGDSPVQALRAGRLDDVARAARAYGEHGAA